MESDLSFEYHCAKAFYRANEGKAFKLGYEEKLRFIALSKQVAKGPFDPEKSADSLIDTSYFNLVGNDRKNAWQKLGNMSREDAMMAFVKELRACCALFEPWYKAHVKIEVEKRKRENGSLLDSHQHYTLSPSYGDSLSDGERGSNGSVVHAGGENHTAADTPLGKELNKRQELDALNGGNFVGGKSGSIAGKDDKMNTPARDSSSSAAVSGRTKNSNTSQLPLPTIYNSGSSNNTVASSSSDSLQHLQQIEQQKALIKNALNTQTFQQFKQYAVSRYPNDEQAQDRLISELQEQHFQQYMQHIYYQQIAHLKAAAAAASNAAVASVSNAPTSTMSSQGDNQGTQLNSNSKLSFERETSNPLTSDDYHKAESAGKSGNKPAVRPAKTDPEKGLYSPSSDNLLVANPSMWTNKNMKEFKDLVKKDSNLVIRVGRGELVTIRVPTHEDGAFLFWEFATDHYDIGFGLHFEWTISPTNEITITAEEPDDEEDEEVVDSGNPNDVEKMQHFDSDGDKPALDVIAPIFRRDSHMEVQAGSHEYPGQGCYLLKFDNTFSLFRGKTLYYRVYYTK